jgi:hypothetical protein
MGPIKQIGNAVLRRCLRLAITRVRPKLYTKHLFRDTKPKVPSRAYVLKDAPAIRISRPFRIVEFAFRVCCTLQRGELVRIAHSEEWF